MNMHTIKNLTVLTFENRLSSTKFRNAPSNAFTNPVPDSSSTLKVSLTLKNKYLGIIKITE
jgi:hypothetical protein